MEQISIIVILLASLGAGVFYFSKGNKSEEKKEKPEESDKNVVATGFGSDGQGEVRPGEVSSAQGTNSPVFQTTEPVKAVETTFSQPQQPVMEPNSAIPAQKSAAVEAYIAEARSRAREIIVEAKSVALKVKTEAEDEVRKVKDRASELEKTIMVEKAQLEAKDRDLENRANSLKAAKETIERKQEEIEGLYKKQSESLEKIASLSRDEAKKLLMTNLERELQEEKGKRIREIEDETKHEADQRAKSILLEAMRFGATDYVVEYTTSKIKLPDEEIKGRIIGKEGRNIKAFEENTGVDLDMDSTPGEVLISSFDPVRREIAKISLERLITDGRIQPARIEEIVQKTTSEVEHIIYKAGDDLCHKVGAYNIPKEIIQMLGKFKYRFSYGQNMIEHTLEETRIGIALAHELGVNVEVVKLGCLFHDIGKVVTEDEGTHVDLGVDLLKKHKISDEVVNCVAEHHEDKPFTSIESAIVNLADHISGARPGARSEDYESYVKRLKDLEAAATSFDGVEKAFAVSAGREVRVFVSPDRVDDASTALLAREIARKIELEQTYPGVVKVIVIRETRAQETAK